MLQSGISVGRRAVIAGIFLSMMVVMTLPWAWIHHYSCHRLPAVSVTERAGGAGMVIDIVNLSGDDDCAICTHAWPSFLSCEPLSALVIRKVLTAPNSSPIQAHASGRMIRIDGRGPPAWG